jgi:uncharacterized SAM-binding protein YcdF (DUF218 family)
MTGIVRRLVRAGAVGAAALVGLLAVGFLLFAFAVTRTPVHQSAKADAIVVLTGGGARLGEAGRLLRNGQGRRLLISGAHPSVTRDDLIRLTGLDGAAFRCCVDVDHAALDTIGNADETRIWAQRHNFHRLIVVTSSYHMPRSLAELSHALPDVELLAHAVSPSWKSGGWWAGLSGLRLLAGEYVKFVGARARLAISRLTDGGLVHAGLDGPRAGAAVAGRP